MTSRETILLLSSPNDLALTVASHGWAHLAPWHWDLAAGRLGRRERIEGRLGMIQITQRDLGSVVLCWDGFCGSDEPQIRVRVRRWLSDDWQPSPAIAVLGDDD